MGKILADCNKQQAKAVLLSFRVTTAVGKLARACKVISERRLIADIQVVFVTTVHQQHPRWGIYEVGLHPRGVALALMFI